MGIERNKHVSMGHNGHGEEMAYGVVDTGMDIMGLGQSRHKVT